jgi:hypothetical protein
MSLRNTLILLAAIVAALGLRTLPAQAATHHGTGFVNPKPGARSLFDTTTPLQPGTGPVQNYTKTYAIFWLPSGYTFEKGGSSSRYESLMIRYLRDVNHSSFLNVLTQYYDSANWITNSSTYSGGVLDTRPYPVRGGYVYTTDADIQLEVAREIKLHNWPYGLHEQFFVYTASGVLTWAQVAGGWSNAGAANPTGYCAYHNAVSGSSIGLQNYSVIYANMPDQDTHYACYAFTSTRYLSPNGDYLADAAISTTSHEQSEAITDPLLSNWRDSEGDEIGDKCAGNYGSPAADGGNVTMNGHRYVLQGEWSDEVGGCAWGRSQPLH